MVPGRASAFLQHVRIYVSHVLDAIGLKPEVARSCIRFSLGRFNTEEDIDLVLKELPDIVKKLREISALDIDEEE